jgi:hypothetical protein
VMPDTEEDAESLVSNDELKFDAEKYPAVA